MSKLIESTADILWSAPVIFVLFAVFVYITYKARFPQRRLLRAFGALFHGKGAYRALSVNLSAVLGIGNITGVALAIAAGGAGAVFWCFVSGLAGAGVQFAECLVCAKYPRQSASGSHGGPMYVLDRFGMRKSAVFYAAVVCVCGLLIGAAIPSGSAAQMLAPHIGEGRGLYVGAFLALSAFFIFTGGGRSAADFCALIIPPLLTVYLVVCFGILYIVRESVYDALCLIIRQAFDLRPLLAGVGGYGFARAVRWGTARGLFSSESGMGTSGIAAAEDVSAQDALSRALSMSCSAVIDTLILATLTGLCFVSSALYLGFDPTNAQRLISDTFSLFPYIGKYFIIICVTFLGFSSIIGWYWVACGAYAFLFPQSRRRYFTALWLLSVLAGPCMAQAAVWSGCDILMMLMLIPNLACVLKVLPNCGAELDIISEKKKKI